MKFLFCLLASAILFVACNQKGKKATTGGDNSGNTVVSRGDSLLITDSSWGWLRSSDNIDELKKVFGEGNVKDDSICGPECADTLAVTFIYKDSPKEFVIYWADSGYHKKIESVRCSGEGAPYHTANNIRTGTTLKELLDLNKKTIVFSGFDWDYGGAIQSYNGGELEKMNVHFTLYPGDTNSDPSLSGDTELNTDMPAVKKSLEKIRVVELFAGFSK